MADFTKGAAIRLTGDFFDGLTRFDPSSLSFRVMSPRGTVATYTYGTDNNVSKISVGRYACDFNVPDAGTWRYRIESVTAGLAGTGEGAFTVAPSAF